MVKGLSTYSLGREVISDDFHSISLHLRLCNFHPSALRSIYYLIKSLAYLHDGKTQNIINLVLTKKRENWKINLLTTALKERYYFSYRAIQNIENTVVIRTFYESDNAINQVLFFGELNGEKKSSSSARLLWYFQTTVFYYDACFLHWADRQKKSTKYALNQSGEADIKIRR